MTIKCDWCGVSFERRPSHVTAHNFCCRRCKTAFSAKLKNPAGYFTHRHLSELNRELNPERMTPETRAKLRQSRLGSGKSVTYSKTYGQATHRLVAEQVLGRKLLPGEVVHHIDGNKRNNAPENLMIFSSQSEHAAWHAAHRKEVMPNE